jgi:hypothetical protein
MSMRRAEDRGVERARPNAEVIDEAAMPRKQSGIFNARN